MNVTFTAHNVRLDDGSFTQPDIGYCIADHPWMQSTRRLLNVLFPGDKSAFRLADLGCLEGGYSVEFARMGFQVLGIEVRESNLAACRYVKENTALPNLDFVKDNVWNIAKYGTFDAIFCCGLFYHLDQPKKFLESLAEVTSKVLILQTHFSTNEPSEKFNLSEPVNHEALEGRWYTEFNDDEQFEKREDAKWSSWDNKRSFWVRREYLLKAIQNVGFDIVLEQFDNLNPDIADSMLHGYYKTDIRGTFIGIKSGDHGEF
jgi:SAM-dependent methyltransferase